MISIAFERKSCMPKKSCKHNPSEDTEEEKKYMSLIFDLSISLTGIGIYICWVERPELVSG